MLYTTIISGIEQLVQNSEKCDTLSLTVEILTTKMASAQQNLSSKNQNTRKEYCRDISVILSSSHIHLEWVLDLVCCTVHSWQWTSYSTDLCMVCNIEADIFTVLDDTVSDDGVCTLGGHTHCCPHCKTQRKTAIAPSLSYATY